jgi:hypothetical protein
MSDQRWFCSWGNEEITVATSGSGSESRWCLSVNGGVVDEEQGAAPRRARYLCCRAPLNGSPHVVEAAVGMNAGELACKIFVDGEMVGGDRNATFSIPDPLSWQEIRARARARFLLRRGGPQGLFVAGAIFISNLLVQRGLVASLFVALLTGVFAGGASAEVPWQAAERLYQRRLEKLADPAWLGSTELTPLRRFASLCLIGTGVVLGLLSVIALVILFSAVGVNALANVWLVAPFAFLTLGVSLIFAATTLRRPRKARPPLLTDQ